MLVLEATSKRQGERHSDYHWCTEGELAYNQGFDCSRMDCGCERGWAGLDSKSATTTVQVVERPELTIEGLAARLARSLFEGGWITTADPGDELVSVFVEEIIETANYFGEGAVLERDGPWVRLRDGSNEAVNPLNRLALEEMTTGALDSGPLDTVAQAMGLLASARTLEEPLLQAFSDAAWPEAQALGCALDWLHHGKLTDEWATIPRWLQHLDSAEITEARRSRTNDGDNYLLTLEFDGEPLGIASAYIAQEGHIETFFAAYEDPGTYIQLTKTLMKQHYAPYRKVSPTTAFDAMYSARDNPLPREVATRPAPWPSNRPYLDFILDRMQWAGVAAQ